MPFPVRVTLADGRVAELRNPEDVGPEEYRRWVGYESDDETDFDFVSLSYSLTALTNQQRYEPSWPFHLGRLVGAYRYAYVLVQGVPTKQLKPELTLEQINQEASW